MKKPPRRAVLFMELQGLEPWTFCMPCRRAPNCATAPNFQTAAGPFGQTAATCIFTIRPSKGQASISFLPPHYHYYSVRAVLSGVGRFDEYPHRDSEAQRTAKGLANGNGLKRQRETENDKTTFLCLSPFSVSLAVSLAVTKKEVFAVSVL